MRSNTGSSNKMNSYTNKQKFIKKYFYIANMLNYLHGYLSNVV